MLRRLQLLLIFVEYPSGPLLKVNTRKLSETDGFFGKVPIAPEAQHEKAHHEMVGRAVWNPESRRWELRINFVASQVGRSQAEREKT